MWGPRLALLLLSSSMLVTVCQGAVAATDPIPRRIVTDLTPVLINQLKEANISEYHR